MISFCKKSVHSLFNNITSTTTLTSQQPTQPSAGTGLSILTNHDHVPKPNNVIESSSLLIKVSPKIKEPIAPETINSCPEQDHIDIRIRRALGSRDADGLASCTESLGFESCTERSMINELDKYINDYYEKTRVKKKSKIAEKKKEKIDMRMRMRLFPPPLKSLNENGKRVFILKPVRKDGRLELTEVQIYRNESLRACREDGRLIMHLVELNRENDRVVNVGTSGVDKLDDTKEKFPENCSGGDDCRWLNDMVGSHGHHHNHNMHGWGQQSVTIK